MRRNVRSTALVITLWLQPQMALCDSSSTQASTVLDPSPFSTCRAAGLGGALSTLANDVDAIYYNPAGIGATGLSGKRNDNSMVKAMYFPFAAVSLNQNAGAVRSEFNAQQAQNDASAGAAIIDANAGKRQFARASIMPFGLVMGRAAVVPVIDHQLAAVPVGDGTGDVNLRYRTFSGLLFGASAADTSNKFSLGVSQAYGTIEETSGAFSYVDMVDSYQRKKILKNNRATYAAKSINAGFTLRMPKGANPAFSLVARNMGNTRNTAKANADEPLVYDEDLTMGFSISPELGHFGRLNFIVEGGYLTQKQMAARKKLRGGVELLLGGDTGKSLFGIRAGGTDAGWSAGLHLNLGLIGVEVESHAIDIGANNNRLIERRNSGIVYIDLGSF